MNASKGELSFGSRLKAQEVKRNFFDLCEEDEVTVDKMRERLQEIRENKEDIEGVDHYSTLLIEQEIERYDICPVCKSELFWDEIREETYCSFCENK